MQLQELADAAAGSTDQILQASCYVVLSLSCMGACACHSCAHARRAFVDTCLLPDVSHTSSPSQCVPSTRLEERPSLLQTVSLAANKCAATQAFCSFLKDLLHSLSQELLQLDEHVAARRKADAAHADAGLWGAHRTASYASPTLLELAVHTHGLRVSCLLSCARQTQRMLMQGCGVLTDRLHMPVPLSWSWLCTRMACG